MFSNLPQLSNRPLLATQRDVDSFAVANDTAQRAIEAVRAGYNVAAFGERGAGKTSFLHFVEYAVRTDRRVIFVDASVASDPATFLQLIRFSLGRAPTPAGAAAESVSSMFRPQRPMTGVSDLLWLLHDLRDDSERDDDEPTTVVVDDVDPKVAHTVFGRLRNEIWNLPYSWLVSAPEESRAAFLTPPADSFFDVTVTIERMPDDALATLLVSRAHGALSLDVATELAQFANGSPRRALTLARNALLYGGTDELVASQAALAAVRERVSTPAQTLYDELQVRGQASASDKELLQSFGWSRQRAARVFAELEEAGLVVATDETREQPGRPRRIYMPAPAGGQ